MKIIKWSSAVLLVVGLIGTGLGLFSSLSFDELIQYDILFDQKLSNLLYHITLQDHQLPFQYLLLHPIVNSSFGQNSLVLFRVPSLLMSLGALYLYYRIIGVFVKQEGLRLLGVGVLTSSSLFITYSYSARPYSSILFFTCALIWSLLNLKIGENKLKWSIFSLLSFELLCSTHYFGLLYGLSVGLGALCWERGPLRKIGVFLSLILLLLGVYWLQSKTTFLLPQRNFPSLNKLLSGVLHFSGGPLNFCFLIGLIIWNKIYKNKVFLKLLIVALSPLVLSLILSYFWRPIFEYRFFFPLIIFSSLLFILLLEKFIEDESIKKKNSGLLVGLVCFALVIQGVGNAANRESVELKPETAQAVNFVNEKIASDQTLVVCGNCPSFYFSRDRVSCMQGWNFKKKPHSHPRIVNTVMIYKLNERYCLNLVENDYRRIKSFKGIDVYERSSVSR